ncbi:MAG: transcriptional repressor [Bauldia sp.]|uniref:transcriptional repressor n=1 Tax=Bauldia sp. TaxID=2575872 RepID=UPI001D9B6ED9|nr:transcriptional repressor [Bauldia sp.]MCB1497387.1 transcriptional repressor [Bauldia sp.]
MANVSPILEHRKHDHRRCAADAISHAREICDTEGLRFTERRQEVLAALLQSHVPASAYDVIDRLGASGHRPAPVSVYRALDFLVEHRFAHRIESRNAYVACDRGADCTDEATVFLLCDKCGAAGEASSADLHGLIAEVTGAVGFVPTTPVIEIHGLCANCRRG